MRLPTAVDRGLALLGWPGYGHLREAADADLRAAETLLRDGRFAEAERAFEAAHPPRQREVVAGARVSRAAEGRPCPRGGVAEPDPLARSKEQGRAGAAGRGPLPARRLRERQDLAGLAGVFPPQLEWDFGFRIGGLVSHEFLRPYAVTFDFSRMTIRLAQATGAPQSA